MINDEHSILEVDGINGRDPLKEFAALPLPKGKHVYELLMDGR
ncbi:hypothetical protein [Ovoidimarina sediminis]|nr:hypothetical protein [Rhodophyticola sp. MJ-SS7]MDU8946617.1 hypothetical protein [Rhodophyticola sp. MJ-SS7]